MEAPACLAVQAAAEAPPSTAVWVQGFALLLSLLIGMAIWAWLAVRQRRGLPLVAYQPRPPVAWSGWDALLIVLGHRLALELASLLAITLLGIEPHAPQGDGAVETEHPVAQLLRESNGAGTVLLCLLSIVLVAPIVEEFVFRVVFQGWLEAEERRLRRALAPPYRWVRGAMPIGLVSLVFAAMHHRPAAPALRTEFLLAAIAGAAVANLAVFAAGLWWLRRRGAAWADLGFDARRLPRDLRLGAIAFLAVVPVVYLVQIAAKLLLPGWMAPDPFGLFVFSIGLGFLYFRTHRCAPPVVLHMALNGTTLLLLLLSR